MKTLKQKLVGTAKWRMRTEAIVMTKDEPSEQEQEAYDMASLAEENLIELLPHGSGIDGTTSIEIRTMDLSKPYAVSMTKTVGQIEQLIVNSEFHHMDPQGYYAGWFGFEIEVTPGLDYDRYDFTITYNQSELSDDEADELYGDYLVEVFQGVLDEEVQSEKNSN